MLESISGINFPRAENTCTRCACVLKLESNPDCTPYAMISSSAESGAGEKVTDFTRIGAKIQELTSQLGGLNL